MNVFACMPPGHQCVQCVPQRPEEDIRSLKIRFADGCEPVRCCQEAVQLVSFYLLIPAASSPDTPSSSDIIAFHYVLFRHLYVCYFWLCLVFVEAEGFCQVPGPGVPGGPQPPPVDAKNAIPVIARATRAFYH